MALKFTTDEELQSVANAIRSKGGTSASLSYPTGFVNAVNALKVGDDCNAAAGDIRSGKTAIVNRAKVTGTMTEKAAATYTPSESAQEIAAGQYLAGKQTISAVSSTYIGSGVTRKAAATYNTSTSDQSIGSGQYLSGAQTIKAVTTSNISAGNIKTGVTVKVGDANNSGRIASVSGTFTADAIATAADMRSGKTAYVNGSKVTGSITDKAAATYNTSTSDQSISANQYLTGAQTIKAVTTSNISAANIKHGVTVKVGDANSAGRIANVTGTFTSSSTVSSGQTAAGAGQIMKNYSAWVNGAEVKGNIAGKTSADMTVSGGTVTVPAGYYATNQTKSVSNGTAKVNDTTLTVQPSISVGADGKITATNNSAYNTITPSVTAGYVTSGTAGTVAVNGSATQQMTTQIATTYNTSTSDQTISSGRYITGTQTIKAVTTSNIEAANIKKGVVVKVGDSNSAGRIKNVTGTCLPIPDGCAPVYIYKMTNGGMPAPGVYLKDVSAGYHRIEIPSGAALESSFEMSFCVGISVTMAYYVSNASNTVTLTPGDEYSLRYNSSSSTAYIVRKPAGSSSSSTWISNIQRGKPLTFTW